MLTEGSSLTKRCGQHEKKGKTKQGSSISLTSLNSPQETKAPFLVSDSSEALRSTARLYLLLRTLHFPVSSLLLTKQVHSFKDVPDVFTQVINVSPCSAAAAPVDFNTENKKDFHHVRYYWCKSQNSDRHRSFCGIHTTPLPLPTRGVSMTHRMEPRDVKDGISKSGLPPSTLLANSFAY